MMDLGEVLLPVEIVLHPSWWYRHTGIQFDHDFFYHPLRRVAVERQMEDELYARFGQYGLGADRGRDLPVVGPVHNAAGYLVSEMLGCEVRYVEDAAPQVVCAEREEWSLDVDAAFRSPAYQQFQTLCDALKVTHGYVTGDVNWSGILNIALDLWGQRLFVQMLEQPEMVQECFEKIAVVIDRFTRNLAAETGSTSHSVNRLVRHLPGSVFLHSECSLHMLSPEHYERFLLRYDWAWSLAQPVFGIHYCGADPHRFAAQFASLPRLDFLDVGWGGDVGYLRRMLPETFLNIRLSPVEIARQSHDEIRASIRERVFQSGNPRLTGVCCINMDDTVTDDRVGAIFETVAELREELGSRTWGTVGLGAGAGASGRAVTTETHAGFPWG